VLHIKHVCLDPNADDSPSKAEVHHVDMSLSKEEKTGCKNYDGKMPESIQGKIKNIFQINFLETFSNARIIYFVCACL